MKKYVIGAVALLLGSILSYQGFCFANMDAWNIWPDLYYFGGLLVQICLLMLFYWKRKRDWLLFLSIFFVSFLPINIYYRKISAGQEQAAFKKGNEILEQLRIYKDKFNTYPTSLKEIGADSYYYIGVVRFPFRFKLDSLDGFQLTFKISGTRDFRYSLKYKMWNAVD